MDEKLAAEYKEQEYQREPLPYKLYLNSLEEVFDFSLVNSFLDLGCSNGRLLEALHRRHESIEIRGVDYFDWAKKYASDSVKDRIQLLDLSQPRDFNPGFDIVNCSEVGEHIEKKAEDVLLDNLFKATNQILVLTWSNATSHDNDQHQNPQPKKYIIKKLQAKGLVYWKEASMRLSSALKVNLGKLGYDWWAHDIMVFRKPAFAKVDSAYFIQNVNTDDVGHAKSYRKAGLHKVSFQERFMELTSRVRQLVSEPRGSAIVRISDGDYFFLRKIAVGSAKPGRRALTKDYEDIDIGLYRRLVWLNDVVTLSVERLMYNRWKRYLVYELGDRVLWKFNFKVRGESLFKWLQHGIDIFFGWLLSSAVFLKVFLPFASRYLGNAYAVKGKQIVQKEYIPMDCVYALVSTKWLFKNFPNQIGLISGGPKLGLIKELIQYPEYRDYIGMESFTDYIEVPQKGAADDVVALSKSIGEQLKRSHAKIFLVAAGSAKVGLMPLLKAYTDTVLIDVGCGVDALAGIVCQDRPYFADWVNYRIKGYDYSRVDFMDQNNPAWNKAEYKTIWLDQK